MYSGSDNSSICSMILKFVGSHNSYSQWITSSCVFVILNGESMTFALYLWEFVESLTAFPQKVFIVVSDRSLMTL